MLKKILLASCLIATSMTAQAGVIKHFGYERDSASNIVTGGGLEWLKWDVTKNMSINSALSFYAADGWSLATSDNIASLFNTFQFGRTKWSGHSLTEQFDAEPWAVGETSGYNHFLALFGITDGPYVVCSDKVTKSCWSEPYTRVNAFFDIGPSSTPNVFGYAMVYDDGISVEDSGNASRSSAVARILGMIADPDAVYGNGSIGVALVRAHTDSTKQVSSPTAISLIALGLVALIFRRRQVLGR